MAGNPKRRQKREANGRINRALRERAANHPSGELVPVKPVKAKMSSVDMREHINEFVARTGYDPFAELVYMVKMNEHVLPLMNGLKTMLKECKYLTEEEHELIASVVAFLDECPPDPMMAMKIHQDALKYLAPQLKSSEVKQTVDQTVTINVQKFGGGE